VFGFAAQDPMLYKKKKEKEKKTLNETAKVPMQYINTFGKYQTLALWANQNQCLQ